MIAKDFYSVFNNYDTFFLNDRFVKNKRGLFVKNRIEAKVVLNKWGWTQEGGWSFLIRLTDLNCEVSLDGFNNNFTIRDVALSDEVLEDYYNELYGEYEITKDPDEVNTSWIAFFDADNLNAVLEKFMPHIIQSANKWIDEQEANGHKCVLPPKLR